MIRRVQLRCPNAHVIVERYYDEDQDALGTVASALEVELRATTPNPSCPICGAHDLRYIAEDTEFDSIADAGRVPGEPGPHGG